MQQPVSALLAAIVVTAVCGQTSVCPVCSDGSSTVPEAKLSALFPATPPGSCSDLVAAAAAATAGTQECDNIHLLTSSFCGCPITQQAPAGKCTLCSDGSPLASDKLNVVAGQTDGIDLPCSSVFISALSFNATSTDCSSFQALGAAFCGCPPLPTPKNSCSLCVDGSPLDPANANRDLGGGITCGLISIFLSQQVKADTSECHGYQATAGPFCGCAYDAATLDEEFGICRVCGPPGTTLPDPDRIVKLVGFGSRASCADFETELAVDRAPKSGCEGDFRDAAAAACCECGDSDSGPTLQFFSKISEGRQGCAWLATQDAATVDLYCSNFAQVRRACPATCGSASSSSPEDSPDATFPSFTTSNKSCKWLARKKEGKQRKICKFSSDARMFCRLTCDTCP